MEIELTEAAKRASLFERYKTPVYLIRYNLTYCERCSRHFGDSAVSSCCGRIRFASGTKEEINNIVYELDEQRKLNEDG